MEHLTKQQTVLISLLVAIVTAIATSVATVSLTDEASTPQQTIYKVIEKSIEKVSDLPVTVTKTPSAPAQSKGSVELSPASIVEKIAPSVVRIYEKAGESRKFVALGVASGGKDGVIASALLEPHTEFSVYFAVTASNREIPVIYQKGEIAGNFSFFTFNYDPKEKNKVASVDLVGISGLKLGANAVALGSKEGGDVVSVGIVNELRSLSEIPSSAKSLVITDMALSSSISGFLLFDTYGKLVALEKGLDEVSGMPIFIDAAVIKSSLAGLL